MQFLLDGIFSQLNYASVHTHATSQKKKGKKKKDLKIVNKLNNTLCLVFEDQKHKYHLHSYKCHLHSFNFYIS